MDNNTMETTAYAEKRGHETSGLFTFCVAGLFLAGFLTLVIFGARVYSSTVRNQRAANEMRAQLSYISTAAKAFDAAGAITAGSGDYGQMITIADGMGYSIKIYCHDGHLLEEYSSESDALDPENASVIGATDTFTVTESSNGVLVINTDAGELILNPRSR